MSTEIVNHCSMHCPPRRPFSHFLSFPPELRNNVLSHIGLGGLALRGTRGICRSHPLLTITARTSKLIHAHVISILFQKVDVNVHNLPRWPSMTGMLVCADSPDVVYHSLGYEYCISRQISFLPALRNHPEYGLLVWDISWTTFPNWVADDDGADGLICEEDTWDFLNLLSNLNRLDLGSLTFRPHRLWPSATLPWLEHSRLVGQMSFGFVKAILDRIDPAKLVSLEFDNLQGFGQVVGRVYWQPIELFN